MKVESPEIPPLLDEAEFVERFESCTLPNSAFHHRDHVRLAWIYLKREPPLVALTRFAEGLQRFARANGHDGLYHETITWAFLFLIRERMERMDPTATWDDFAAANPDLLTWKPSILDRYYRSGTLGSDLARRVFVMPDR
jgi:hypothetical protein